MLAKMGRARGEPKELGIFFTFMATLPRTRIPAFVDLCRASFYPDPLCIEVLYLAHYLAHPRLQPMVSGGLMMESEKKIFEMMNKKAAMSKYWMPLVWATNIINRARKEALITSDQVVQTLLVELSDIRKRLGALIGYDTVCVPLVYTQ
ncbi:lysozyme-like protein isoform x2 protein, partial [Lasius niger]